MSQSKTKTKPHPSDEEIVELYFARDEQAIAETDRQYGKVCMQVSMNIVESHPDAEVDYIHGEDSLRTLANAEHAIGFLFDGMEKSQLFRTVIYDGALPRKTFSMGHARDKRYYLECRKIK